MDLPSKSHGEEFVLIIDRPCFYACPRHFGLGCEDWYLWLIACILYSCMLFWFGWCLHGGIVRLFDYYMNSKRKKRPNDINLQPFTKKKKFNERKYFDSDSEEEYTSSGRKDTFTFKMKKNVKKLCSNYICCLRNGQKLF